MNIDNLMNTFVSRKTSVDIPGRGFTDAVMQRIAYRASSMARVSDVKFGKYYLLALAACVVVGVMLGVMLGSNLPLPSDVQQSVFCYENMQIENYFFNG